MADRFTKIILRTGKEQSLLRFHPWVFSGAIKKIEGEVKEGDIVKVYDAKGQFLATGHYQPGTIAVRVFSFEDVTPGQAFWTDKVRRAFVYRQRIGLAGSVNTNVFRLVNAEGDYFPGLVADFYNGTLVLQMHSVGMYLLQDILVNAFREVLGSGLKTVFNKSEATLPFRAEVPKSNGYLFGTGDGELEVQENGLRFLVDIQQGQKTGFFIDQRENRKLLKHFSGDHDVLNMFGYTGGFSVYALSGGAGKVVSVDSSGPAIALTRRNVELNGFGLTNHEAVEADAFEYLKNATNAFDLIVLDPPAFAKHNEALHQALKGYQRLNAMAIDAIRPGGVLFTFSCSQVVSRLHFRQAVFGAAAQSKRKVRILHQLTQPPDHPVDICHPEGEYLKGLVLYVE